MKDLDALAERLDEAARSGTATPQLTLEHDLTEDEAYEIQRRSMARRFARGESLVGLKMGLTSRAKMRQVGVNEVIWGHLTSAMVVEDGSSIRKPRYVHPRAEPEVAFLLKKPLQGPISVAQAMSAVEAVAPAVEIIDSRYENFKFALADVIADNSSSSGFVVGPWHRPDVDYGNLGIVLEQNGRPAQIGSSAAILGHPARSLAAASRLAALRGVALEAGWVVMAGGATAAVHLAAGDHVRVSIETLGRVSFSVEA